MSVSALQADDLNAPCGWSLKVAQQFLPPQNIFATPTGRAVLALMLASKLHTTVRGAHGGGFAGTTLNFVPKRSLDSFVKEMEAVFGAHSCNVLTSARWAPPASGLAVRSDI